MLAASLIAASLIDVFVEHITFEELLSTVMFHCHDT